MTELWLKFTDENGKPQRILVEGEKYSIGRTPENDLQIKNNSLSRKHIQIERYADIFVVSDCGSSNGSMINEEPLEQPVAIGDSDKLRLGNAIDIECELISGEKAGEDGPPAKKEEAAAPAIARPKAPKEETGVSPMFFVVAPLMGILVVAIMIGGFLLLGEKEPETANKEDIFIRSDQTPLPLSDDEDEDTPTPKPTDSPKSGNTTPPADGPEIKSTATPEIAIPNTPKISSEADKIERNAYSFMKKIAQNDSNPVLTGEQVKILSAKINQIKGSPSLRENIRAIRQSKAQIITFAGEKNIKPQFLATAVLTKLGNERGDVIAGAQQAREVLDNLAIPIGNGLADDCLLVMAAYFDEDKLKMRDMLANLTKNSPASSRQIRTIWFLKDKGKITESQFEFALRFLAIGTITQNPKEFSVNEEAVNFN